MSQFLYWWVGSNAVPAGAFVSLPPIHLYRICQTCPCAFSFCFCIEGSLGGSAGGILPGHPGSGNVLCVREPFPVVVVHLAHPLPLSVVSPVEQGIRVL